MKVLRIGHRGACGHAPENTLASIEQAIALDCALTEADVRRTADGSLVLLHDERVDRTTNGKGPVAEMTLEDLQKLDAGEGQRIPTLEEALQAAAGRIGLILEIKAEGLAYDVCGIVRASGFTGPIIYASFLHDELQHLRRADQEARTMVLFKRLPKDPAAEAASLQATHVGLRFDTAAIPLVKALHTAGLVVFIYTVNKQKDIQRMRTLGVDGIVVGLPGQNLILDRLVHLGHLARRRGRLQLGRRQSFGRRQSYREPLSSHEPNVTLPRQITRFAEVS